MGDIIVRKMQPEDLLQVCEIEKDNFSLPWSEKSFLESMERNDTVFLVALNGEEVAGYLGCYCVAGEGEITNVAVKSSYRRQGIGVKLFMKRRKCFTHRSFFWKYVKATKRPLGFIPAKGL